MQTKTAFPQICKSFYRALAILLSVALVLTAEPLAFASSPQEQAAPAAAKIPADQLDSLVAPIALYPDPLLSQTLVASTYPLELVQLQQWLAKNKGLKDKALTDAVMKQPWDPSIQSMAPFPDLVKQLVENIQWTTDLGNAFLAQQSDVMDAVQRMRKKASDKGNLKSSEQQKVEVKTVESKQVIVIEQSNPEVVYVPSYNPTVVYGAPAYAYPPIAYPPVGYYAAGMALSFGVGVAMGAVWGGGGWGYNSGWGSNNTININNNNNFVNNSNRQNVQGGNRAQAKGGNNTWQHNPQHRGGAPYSDRNTANKFGGSARGDSMSARQNTARQNQARGNQGNIGRGEGFDSGNRGASAGNRGAGVSNDMAGGGRGGDRAGNQSMSRGSSSGAFGGGGNRASASASSSRGSSSMGRSGGGGGGRSGGGGRRGR